MNTKATSQKIPSVGHTMLVQESRHWNLKTTESELKCNCKCQVNVTEKFLLSRPKPGSLTEYRGMKANIHVFQELIDLCAVINQEGRNVKGEPELREITFGEIFQIYVHINDKVLGLLLRARKHELLTFEGEVLFQKFHDHVHIYLLRPFKEIKSIMSAKQEEIRRSLSPNPRWEMQSDEKFKTDKPLIWIMN